MMLPHIIPCFDHNLWQHHFHLSQIKQSYITVASFSFKSFSTFLNRKPPVSNTFESFLNNINCTYNILFLESGSVELNLFDYSRSFKNCLFFSENNRYRGKHKTKCMNIFIMLYYLNITILMIIILINYLIN